MPAVRVILPSLLGQITGTRSVELEAATVAGVLEGLVARHPQLKVHLYDERGRFREHVLCFHNATNTRWMDSLDVPVADGDEVTLLQAVSGG